MCIVSLKNPLKCNNEFTFISVNQPRWQISNRSTNRSFYTYSNKWTTCLVQACMYDVYRTLVRSSTSLRCNEFICIHNTSIGTHIASVRWTALLTSIMVENKTKEKQEWVTQSAYQTFVFLTRLAFLSRWRIEFMHNLFKHLDWCQHIWLFALWYLMLRIIMQTILDMWI